MDRKDIIKNINTITIKIGYSSLINAQGNFDTAFLNNLVDNVITLKKLGKKVLIVTSGAVSLGNNIAGTQFTKTNLLTKQAFSCIGQIDLMQRYQESFSRNGITIAQLLLTIEDIDNRKRYISAQNVMKELLNHDIVPLINENDLITNTEIRFGDNDRLAARVAQFSNSNLLILLSSKVEGLYDYDPNTKKDVNFIKEIYDVNADIEQMALDSQSKAGGMSAKLAAAKIAMGAGCHVMITKSSKNNNLKELIEGKTKATWFFSNTEFHHKYIKEKL